MKRYYVDDHVELWHGDIRDGVPSVGGEPVSCAVTSPPYNVGLEYDVHDDRMDWADVLRPRPQLSSEICSGLTHRGGGRG